MAKNTFVEEVTFKSEFILINFYSPRNDQKTIGFLCKAQQPPRVQEKHKKIKAYRKSV